VKNVQKEEKKKKKISDSNLIIAKIVTQYTMSFSCIYMSHFYAADFLRTTL